MQRKITIIFFTRNNNTKCDEKDNTVQKTTIYITYYSELIQNLYEGPMQENLGNVKSYD
jgi:hypothetical protein